VIDRRALVACLSEQRLEILRVRGAIGIRHRVTSEPQEATRGAAIGQIPT